MNAYLSLVGRKSRLQSDYLSRLQTPFGPALSVHLREVPECKERQGPTLGVRLSEVSVLQRCPLRES